MRQLSLDAGAESIKASNDFPLADGNSWTCSVHGAFVVTSTISPGTTPTNGVATKAVQESDGKIGSCTSDANGIRQHGEFDRSPPANNRVLVNFEDAHGIIRGSTSVAVRTL